MRGLSCLILLFFANCAVQSGRHTDNALEVFGEMALVRKSSKDRMINDEAGPICCSTVARSRQTTNKMVKTPENFVSPVQILVTTFDSTVSPRLFTKVALIWSVPATVPG